MPDYKNGKIYTIQSYQTDLIYIGSTTQTLHRRLSKHKSDKKGYEQKGRGSNTASYKILEFDDAYIELLELCPCDTKIELLKREGHFIREMDCVNKVVPGRSKAESSKEYRLKNKEKIAIKDKAYVAKNKEKIVAYKKQHAIENKEKIAAYKKQYRIDNKEKVALMKKKYSSLPHVRERTNFLHRQYTAKNKVIISEKGKIKVPCPECGTLMRKDSIRKHTKRKHSK